MAATTIPAPAALVAMIHRIRREPGGGDLRAHGAYLRAQSGKAGRERIRRHVAAVFGRPADAVRDPVRAGAFDAGVGQLPGNGEGIETSSRSGDLPRGRPGPSRPTR